MKVIGLTGSIASGKSTISNYLKQKGINIIDADLISREIYNIGHRAYNEVVKEFGERILNEDKTINRKELGKIVFTDKEKLKRLNQITHPIIIDEIKRKIDYYKNLGKKICIVDAALLIETGLNDLVDEVWLVFVDFDKQIKRLMDRDNLSFDDAKKRIMSQMPFEEKKKHADYIIDNSYNLKNTLKQVDKLLEVVLGELNEKNI